MTKEQYIQEAHKAGKTVYVYQSKITGKYLFKTLDYMHNKNFVLIDKIPPSKTN